MKTSFSRHYNFDYIFGHERVILVFCFIAIFEVNTQDQEVISISMPCFFLEVYLFLLEWQMYGEERQEDLSTGSLSKWPQ